MRNAVLLATICLLGAARARGELPNAPLAEGVTVTVDVSKVTGEINRNLVGVDWKLGTADAVNALAPNLARADIAFQDAAKADGTFDWSFADAWVNEAKAAGAEPMAILTYMPPWLADLFPGDPRDPTKVRPADYARWEAVVEAGVEHLARDLGVRRFEVWNEPDFPGFWEDSPDAFLETARHSARAVRRVAERLGIELEIGGPACLFPDPVCVAGWLGMMRSEGIRPDFVSWHYYGNYPFVGADRREPSLPEPIYPVLGRRNPIGGVAYFPFGVELVRALTEISLAGTGWSPELVLDEWNVSASGFDVRHDTHEGAAFDAGVLAELQRTRLDRAAFFISKDAYLGSAFPCEEGAGDWGLVSCAGNRKPAWWTFWLWNELAADEVATTGSSLLDGFSAVASRDGASRVTVLLSSFLSTAPHDHRVTLRLDGLPTSTMIGEIRRIDAGYASAESPSELVAVSGPSSVLELDLPANSVLFLDLQSTR
jgi:glycosyl hydrolase family 39 (putative alpha-L-iduronidase)